MEQSDNNSPQRRSLRLRGYDYSQAGAYFVAICTYERRPMLGRIVGSEMQLSSLGTIVRDCWVDLSNHHRGLELDAFVVMPNHMHGILIIADGGESAGSNRDAGEAGLAPTVAYSG